MGIPPAWESHIIDYRVTMEGAVRAENRVALLNGGVPADPQSPPRERVVLQIDSEAKKTSMLKSLVPGTSGGAAKSVAFTISSAAEKAMGLSGPALATKTFVWLVENSETVQNVRRTEASLKELIALGGAVITTEEICKLEGQYYLRKGWIYRVKVGEETRVVPLAFIYHKAR